MDKTISMEPINLSMRTGSIPHLTHIGTIQCMDLVISAAKLSDGTIYIPAAELDHILDWLMKKDETPPAQERARKMNIEARLQKFRSRALEVHNKARILSKEQAAEWFAYWTERGEEDFKHRWEKEKSFDIERRMKTWRDRNHSGLMEVKQPLPAGQREY